MFEERLLTNWKYMCLHDAHGYFIGRWVTGQILRLSLEYFASKDACLEAIRSKCWTRRRVLQ